MSTTAPIPSSTQRSTRGRAIALLGVVFVLGMASGLGGGALWLRRQIRTTIAAPAEAEGAVGRLMARLESNLASELSLTAEQRTAVREEFQTAERQFRQLRTQFATDGEQLAQDTVAAIERRLPPDKHQALRDRVRERLEVWGIQLEAPERK